MHELFAHHFPGIAEAETRVIHVIGNEMEVHHDTQENEAVISFGWESLDFYRCWNHGVVDGIIRDFKRPSLATLFKQGKYARQWLLFVFP